VAKYKVEKGRLMFYLTFGEDGLWISEANALSCWPREVLNFYLSSLAFGRDDERQPISAGVNGDEEEAELQLILHSLRLGAVAMNQSSTLATALIGLIRLSHDGSVLASLAFDDRKETFEGLLPLSTCQQWYPHLLLDFLHASISLKQNEKEEEDHFVD